MVGISVIICIRLVIKQSYYPLVADVNFDVSVLKMRGARGCLASPANLSRLQLE